MARLPAVLLLLCVALGGCVSELLDAEDLTVRTFACAVLDPADGRPVFFELHRERGVQRVPLAPLGDIASFLEAQGLVGEGRVTVAEAGLLEPDGPWTAEALAEWGRDVPVLESDAVRLQVLWVSSFENEAPTVQVVSPGVVAVSEAAVREGALRLDRSEEFLADVLMWHIVGHALGAVNQGIPLNGTDPAAQEGPPGHEPAADSVLHAGWHRVSTLPRNDVPSAYSMDVVDDWRAAVDGGVCA